MLDDEDEMDALFREAFDSMTECRKSVDRMRPGAGIRTFTPAAESNAWGLVPQGEGSCKVRVLWGLDSPGLPLYFIPCRQSSETSVFRGMGEFLMAVASLM